jgi:pSer/pThr/pTyr-binding forkhead associated (FHA) protein
MPTLHILTEGFPQKSFDLPEGVTSVGRDDDNAIHIADASLSGNHGEFIVTGGAVVFRDLDSTNGSFLDNEQQINGEATLAEGAVFRLGSVYMQLGNGHIEPEQSKRTTTLIHVNPVGVKPEELESVNDEEVVESPFKRKKSLGSKIFIIVVVVMFIVSIAILAYTLYLAS